MNRTSQSFGLVGIAVVTLGFQSLALGTLGTTAAVTPEALLPDRVDSAVVANPYTRETAMVRKGTLSATIHNVARLNVLLGSREFLSTKGSEEVHNIKATIRDLIESVRITGLFDLFSIREWLSNDNQLGRIFVGLLYLQKYPATTDILIEKRLRHLAKETKNEVLAKELEVTLNVIGRRGEKYTP